MSRDGLEVEDVPDAPRAVVQLEGGVEVDVTLRRQNAVGGKRAVQEQQAVLFQDAGHDGKKAWKKSSFLNVGPGKRVCQECLSPRVHGQGVMCTMLALKTKS